MAIIDNPGAGGGGGGGSVDETSALQYMLNHKTNYIGIAAGLANLTTLPTFTQGAVREFYGAFQGCSSLTDASQVSVGVSPNTANSLAHMFDGCSSLTAAPDFSMSGAGALLINDLNGIMRMFYNCSSLTQVNFTSDGSMRILRYNVNMKEAFYNCKALTQFAPGNLLKTDRTKDFTSAFSQCESLQSVVIDIGKISSTTEIKATSMFSLCTSLVTVGAQGNGFKYITDGQSMFSSCSALTTVSGSNFTGLITATAMFNGCSALTTVPDFDGNTITRTQNMFQNCTSLVTAPLFSDTSHVDTFAGMFNGCSALENVGTFDMSGSSSSPQNMFQNCQSLTNTSLNNILASLLTNGATRNKTLKYIGLTSAQATTCTGLSNWSALSAAGWITGY